MASKVASKVATGVSAPVMEDALPKNEECTRQQRLKQELCRFMLALFLLVAMFLMLAMILFDRLLQRIQRSQLVQQRIMWERQERQRKQRIQETRQWLQELWQRQQRHQQQKQWEQRKQQEIQYCNRQIGILRHKNRGNPSKRSFAKLIEFEKLRKELQLKMKELQRIQRQQRTQHKYERIWSQLDEQRALLEQEQWCDLLEHWCTELKRREKWRIELMDYDSQTYHEVVCIKWVLQCIHMELQRIRGEQQ
jgi:hypothetical protein